MKFMRHRQMVNLNRAYEFGIFMHQSQVPTRWENFTKAMGINSQSIETLLPSPSKRTIEALRRINSLNP